MKTPLKCGCITSTIKWILNKKYKFLHLTLMNDSEIQRIIDASYENFILSEQDPCFLASQNPSWSYEPIFTELLISSYHNNNLEKVIQWWKQEFHNDPHYYKQLEKTYINNMDELPLIVLEGCDGHFYINDGHHRYAIALMNQLSPLWCIVGRPK